MRSSGQGNLADLNLVIAVDCSFSVSTVEYHLQRRGLAAAFRDPEIIAAIESAGHGRIAVSVLQWSSRDSQTVAIPWLPITDADSAEVLALALENMNRRSFDGSTSISAALLAATRQIADSPFVAARNVIDMQADGTNNNGPYLDRVRDQTLERGIVINGLAIVNEVPWLDRYFVDHVIGGDAAFVEVATDYEAFAVAIKRKLLREIPTPRLAEHKAGFPGA